MSVDMMRICILTNLWPTLSWCNFKFKNCVSFSVESISEWQPPIPKHPRSRQSRSPLGVSWDHPCHWVQYIHESKSWDRWHSSPPSITTTAAVPTSLNTSDDSPLLRAPATAPPGPLRATIRPSHFAVMCLGTVDFKFGEICSSESSTSIQLLMAGADCTSVSGLGKDQAGVLKAS